VANHDGKGNEVRQLQATLLPREMTDTAKSSIPQGSQLPKRVSATILNPTAIITGAIGNMGRYGREASVNTSRSYDQ